MQEIISYKRFGSWLREARKRIGMGQKDVADALMVTNSSVSAWERGINPPCGEEIRAKLSELLHFDVEAAIQNNDNPEYRIEYDNFDYGEKRHPPLVERVCDVSYIDKEKIILQYSGAGQKNFFPPWIVSNYDILPMIGGDDWSFPTDEEFDFILAKITSGDLAAEMVWPNISIRDRAVNVLTFNHHINNGEEYGHGEAFWKQYAMWIASMKEYPETAFDLPRHVFFYYIDAYMDAKAKVMGDSNLEIHYTLDEIIKEVYRIYRAGEQCDGWVRLATHRYTKQFYDEVCGEKFGSYAPSKDEESFDDFATSFYRIFDYGFAGFYRNVIFPLFCFKEVPVQTDRQTIRIVNGIEKRRWIKRKKAADGYIDMYLYARPSRKGFDLLRWSHGEYCFSKDFYKHYTSYRFQELGGK